MEPIIEDLTFNGKNIRIIFYFQKDKYGDKEFRRDIGNYIRAKRITNLGKAYPKFDYCVKTVCETIKSVIPQVLNKVPYIIQGNPFVIEFKIHDAEGDSYHSYHNENLSRLDYMCIELNGKSLTNIFIAPFYFRRFSPVSMPDINLKLIIDLVSLFQFQASLPKYRYIQELKKKSHTKV